jgi:hypothetical protein
MVSLYKPGSKCPFCTIGKLNPSGLRQIEEKMDVESGESKRERTEFECDNCHRKVNAYGIELKN